jgi:hypothetical protein
MARSRNIKPGFFKNEKLAEVHPLGRLLFAGLWCLADREGRLEDRPKRIKAEILPYDDCNIDQLLEELVQRQFICRYQAGGMPCIQVNKFSKHQNPHKNEAASTIPAASQGEQPAKTGQLQVMAGTAPEITGKAPEMHSTAPADSFNLIPDSLNLNPDTCNLIAESKTNMCVEPPNDESPKQQPPLAKAEGAQAGKPGTGKNPPAGKSAPREEAEYTEDFEHFWAIFPRQLEKKTAYKSWQARLKEKVEPKILLKAARNYAAHCRDTRVESRFIKHPKTFLGPNKPYEDFVGGPPEAAGEIKGVAGVIGIGESQKLPKAFASLQRYAQRESGPG